MAFLTALASTDGKWAILGKKGTFFLDGFGAILSWTQDDKVKVIAFGRKTLSQTEWNYSIAKKRAGGSGSFVIFCVPTFWLGHTFL